MKKFFKKSRLAEDNILEEQAMDIEKVEEESGADQSILIAESPILVEQDLKKEESQSISSSEVQAIAEQLAEAIESVQADKEHTIIDNIDKEAEPIVEEIEIAIEDAENENQMNQDSQEIEESLDDGIENEQGLTIGGEVSLKAKKAKKTNQEGTGEKKVIFTKKAKLIIIAIAVAIVVLTVSIVTPILVLNQGKIFIDKASDFDKNKDGDIYIINKDINYEGDLTLSKDIDLSGNNLVVNGTLTLDASGHNINIGTKKKGEFTSQGLISAEKIVVTNRGKVSIASNLTCKILELTNTEVEFGSNITISNQLDIKDSKIAESTDSAIVFKGEVMFGEAKSMATISKSNVAFDKGIFASLDVKESFIRVNNIVGNTTLDMVSEFRCNAMVLEQFSPQELGTVRGGGLVYMSENSQAQLVDGADIYWTCQSNMNIYREENIKQKNYIVDLERPYANILIKDMVVNGVVAKDRIVCKMDRVVSATRYAIYIDQEEEPTIYTLDPSKSTLEVDLTEKLNKVGNHVVTIVARGEDNDSEFIKDSEPIKVFYEHKLDLETPKNINVNIVEGKQILTFEKTPFADYYEVYIDLVKLDKIISNDAIISVDLSSNPLLVGKLNVGRHVVTVVAKSNNPNIKPSSKDFCTFIIKGIHNAPVLTHGEITDGTMELSWGKVDTAITYTIYKKNSQGEDIAIATVKSTNYNLDLGKYGNGEYYIKADGISGGYYTESVASDSINISQ